ncbi:MAG: helix-turn-helix domain-containing protein [Alphaproteobacteria bacterium]|nr:helix-turn-helix domain-containing protein [Alphaproteobacteria bacterium]MBO6629922.1 helix-turn-helix domain-containing protein [Alphaproteobacteria bacterium]
MSDDLKEAGLQYVRDVLSRMGWTPTKLAQEAGLSQSTITRPLNSSQHKFAFSQRTLLAIEKATGMPRPGILGGTTHAAAPSLKLPNDINDASVLLAEYAISQANRSVGPDERVRIVREFRRLLSDIRGSRD